MAIQKRSDDCVANGDTLHCEVFVKVFVGSNLAIEWATFQNEATSTRSE